MRGDLNVSFTLKLWMCLLSFAIKLEQSSDNSPVELTSISYLAFIFTDRTFGTDSRLG